MKRILLLFVVMLYAALSLYAKDKYIHLVLNGKSYDSLFIYGTSKLNKRIVIPGIKLDHSTWSFILPDSLSRDLLNFQIAFSPFSHQYHTMGYIALKYEQDESLENRVSKFSADSDSLLIDATFKQQIEDKDNQIVINPISKDKTLAEIEITVDVFCVKDTNGIRPKIVLDNYDLRLNGIEEHESKIRIDNFAKLIDQYPNSRDLMFLLDLRYSYFKSAQDVEKLYNKFSSDEKQSYWGNEVYQRFNYTFFSNTTLKRWDNMEDEDIVICETKPTLIIFSASWCRPCREEIPQIKDLYHDLKENVDFVYVSIDEKISIKNWQELMKKEKIEWRSLVAPDNLDYVKTKYLIRGVPEYYLVDTDGVLSILDFEKQNDMDKLYRYLDK